MLMPAGNPGDPSGSPRRRSCIAEQRGHRRLVEGLQRLHAHQTLGWIVPRRTIWICDRRPLERRRGRRGVVLDVTHQRRFGGQGHLCGHWQGDLRAPLASQKYLPTDEPKTADLLIVVFWGRTIGTNAFGGSELGQTLDGGEKDKIDSQNAKLLGFDSERVFDQGFDDPSNMMSNIRRQVHSGTIDAIEADRYFVVL